MPESQDFTGLVEWRCIGPFRGGRVVAVSGSYHDRKTFYFGACAGGVWKTTDAGAYWQCVSDGYFSTSSVGALAVAPSDSNVIYAGTGETTIRIDVSHGDGVYKSTDEGRTWTNVGLRDTRHIGKIRVHPHDPDTVWVAALGHAFGPNPERGVFKSDDGGQTWRHVLAVSDKAGAVDLTHDANPRILYAGVWEARRSFWQLVSGGPDSGLWQSTDSGETWVDISRRPGLPQGTFGKIGVAASPAKSGRVWALIEHADEGGLYRSDDMGQTWEKVSDNQVLLSRAWYYTHLTADPQDPDTVYVNNLCFWKSTDGGKTFTQIATPHGDNHDLWIDPLDNQRMIQGNDGGANVSLNGGFSFSSIYNQPTAQFYHLAADTREPYTVYGTQQDNSSIGVPSAVNHAAILWQDCFIAGSGESGYIAVDPEDPDIVYVGAIGSSPGGGNALQRYDRRSDQIRLVTTWPEGTRGLGAEDHKYRFAWTYPIVFSPHDPSTIYIGGNMVFKSTNEGQSWEPISPDLTKADPETLKPSGGPINRDAVGAETYATVFSLAVSPHAPGLLWAGSDDGLIHLSRDDGANWENITPKDLPEWTLISCIEPSPFDADTVYVAGTRYKLDDYRPYLFVTRDAGKTWVRIDNGIPEDDFTRVIRADPEQLGLLYAGTETGLYVSFDDGVNWQRLQLNLPVAPIHDLLVKNGDLIAGTHGRSIWILDDLTPLRTIAAGEGAGDTFLFQPRDTLRILPGVDWSGHVPGSVNYLGGREAGYLVETTEEGTQIRTYLDAGANPPRGAVITYRLDKVPDAPISLTFSTTGSEEIRRFTSRLPDDERPPKELRLPALEGFNRFVWDLRYASATKIEGTDPAAEAIFLGPIVAPGEYRVTLSVGDRQFTREFRVVKPANRPASQADLEAQVDLLMRIHQLVDTCTQTVNRMRDLRGQLSGWEERTRGTEGEGEVAELAKALREQVLEIEEQLVVPDLRPGWADAINRGARLIEKLADLTEAVQLGDYRPTDAAEAVFAELSAKTTAELNRFESLVNEKLPPLNERIAALNLGAIVSR